jgi:hypothetical protein
MRTSHNLRTELLAILSAIASPYSDVADFPSVLEEIRDYLTDRDGGGDPDLHQAFQAVFDAVSDRMAMPDPSRRIDGARRP